MGGFSIWHWLVLGIIVLLLFGKGRFSDMMGDVAKGLKSFKKGMADEDELTSAQRRIAEDRAAERARVADPVDLTPDPTRSADPLDRREP